MGERTAAGIPNARVFVRGVDRPNIACCDGASCKVDNPKWLPKSAKSDIGAGQIMASYAAQFV